MQDASAKARRAPSAQSSSKSRNMSDIDANTAHAIRTKCAGAPMDALSRQKKRAARVTTKILTAGQPSLLPATRDRWQPVLRPTAAVPQLHRLSVRFTPRQGVGLRCIDLRLGPIAPSSSPIFLDPLVGPHFKQFFSNVRKSHFITLPLHFSLPLSN